jgi:hypothetical protein
MKVDMLWLALSREVILFDPRVSDKETPDILLNRLWS